MIRSLALFRTALLKSSQNAASVVAAAGGGGREALLTRLTTTKTNRTFSTAHDHDSGVDNAPPKIKNSFGGHFQWDDPLCIKSSLTEEEVRL